MIYRKRPHVTCVMVTRGRLELMKRSIACYMNQTFIDKNMVVLSQGDPPTNSKIREYIRSLGREDIFLVDAPPDLTLGAMRNTSVELATGDLVCQWDDDDLSHPDRITTQYKSLISDDRNVAAMYCDFLKYYRTTGELYWCDWSNEGLPHGKYICNTLMFWKRQFGNGGVVYPETGPQCQVEEDLNVLIKLLKVGEVAKVFAGWQFFYVFHGGNVYDIDHHNLTLKTSTGKRVLTVEQLNERRGLIEESIRLVGIDRPVTVRSLDADAFTYFPQ